MRELSLKARIILPKLELNKDAMKHVRMRAGEAITPVVQDRVRADWNEEGELANSVGYIGGKVRPNSRKRSDSKLNNYGIARVLAHRTGQDPFRIDSPVQDAGARGAQLGLKEVEEAVLAWDGFEVNGL